MLHLDPLYRAARRTLAVLLLGWSLAVPVAQAADLPVAAGSPLAGIAFDDRPLLLPVQRNFQMAMLTAGSELGRTCGAMEAYGWRMEQGEQGRVNQIFDNTVDRMRAQGFAVEAKAPTSVSRDITMFTADRPDKHMLFMWSAGEIGLVLVLCETSAPPAVGTFGRAASLPPSPVSDALRYRHTPRQPDLDERKIIGKGFSPVGDWVGRYTCAQGTSGATLQIASVRGEQFTGTFRFYPTPKNPYVPSGSYRVSGEYDADTGRILINPGAWVQRPKNPPNTTIIIGSFDPAAKTFSGYFQGITGCTSIEARQRGASDIVTREASDKPVKKKAVKAQKKSAAKAAKHGKGALPVEPAPKAPDVAVDSIMVGEPATPVPTLVATPPAAPPQAPAPAEPVPTPTPIAPVPTVSTPAEPAPAPSAPVPAPTEPMPAAPAPMAPEPIAPAPKP